MNQYFSGNYIQKLSIQHIKDFANYHQVSLSDVECEIILTTIKQNWKELLYGDYLSVFQKIRNQVTPESYEIALQLYHDYKRKYQSFL